MNNQDKQMETVLTLAKAHYGEILTNCELLLKYMEVTNCRNIIVAIMYILRKLDSINEKLSKKLQRESEKHE